MERADAILCINMVHISPWEATLGLFAGAAGLLGGGAPLIPGETATGELVLGGYFQIETASRAAAEASASPRAVVTPASACRL